MILPSFSEDLGSSTLPRILHEMANSGIPESWGEHHCARAHTHTSRSDIFIGGLYICIYIHVYVNIVNLYINIYIYYILYWCISTECIHHSFHSLNSSVGCFLHLIKPGLSLLHQVNVSEWISGDPRGPQRQGSSIAMGVPPNGWNINGKSHEN